MTIRELLAEGRTLFSSANFSTANIENPALDAALLLARVLNTSREGLIINGGKTVSGIDRKKFHKLLKRRLGGECTAYILHLKEFMGLDFFVNSHVLVPRPDTEILAETALKAGDSASNGSGGIALLDLCTGSGALPVSLKHQRPSWEIWAADISARALKTARKNALRLLAQPGGIHFIKSDLYGKLKTKKGRRRFDIIVSNPPYVASARMEELAPEIKREPRLALDGGEDGLVFTRRIIREAPLYLKPEGRLLLEADPEQMENITVMLKDSHFSDIKREKDLSGNERVIEGKLEH